MEKEISQSLDLTNIFKQTQISEFNLYLNRNFISIKIKIKLRRNTQQTPTSQI